LEIDSFEAAMNACVEDAKNFWSTPNVEEPLSEKGVYEAASRRMEEKIGVSDLSPEALKNVEEAKIRALRLLSRGLRDIDRASHL